MQLEPKTGPHAFALQADGDEKQRRTIGAGAVLRRPLQESQTQVKDIRAALLEGQSRCAKQIGEASFQIGFRHVRVKFPARHGFEDEVLASVLVLPLGE